MPDFVVVFCTCRDRNEASQLAHALVERRLAACVNIVPAIESVYRWQEKVEVATESLLFIKTTGARFQALRDAIGELHSYETPEIVALPVRAGFEKYLDWILASV